MLPRARTATRSLFLNGVDEIGAAGLARFGLDSPAVAQGVAQLYRIQLLSEAHAIADVQARREIAAEDQRSIVGEVGLEPDVLDADLGTQLLRENGAALRDGLRGGTVLAVLHALQRAAREQQRQDLGLRQRRIREIGNARLTQAAADVDSRGHVRKHLDGTNIDAGILDHTPVEDEPAALDVELAPVGGVFSVLDGELTGAAGDVVRTAMHRNTAREACLQPQG